MKKRYILNGKIYDEETLGGYAQKSGLSFNDYLKESGATEHNDTNIYELNGKEYDGNTMADYAQKSNLAYDDYLKESGAVKKKGNTASAPSLEKQSSQLGSEESGAGLKQPTKPSGKATEKLNQRVDQLGKFYQHQFETSMEPVVKEHQDLFQKEYEAKKSEMQKLVDGNQINVDAANKQLKEFGDQKQKEYDAKIQDQATIKGQEFEQKSKPDIDKFLGIYNKDFQEEDFQENKETNPALSLAKTAWTTLSKDIPSSAYAARALGTSAANKIENKVSEALPKPSKELSEGLSGFITKGMEKIFGQDVSKYQLDLTPDQAAKSLIIKDFQKASNLEKAGAEQKKYIVNSLDKVKDGDFMDMLNYAASASGQGIGYIPLSVGTHGLTSYVTEMGSIYMDATNRIAEEESKRTGKKVTVEDVIKEGKDNVVYPLIFGLGAGLLDSFGANKVAGAFTKQQVMNSFRKRAFDLIKTHGIEAATEGAQGALENGGVTLSAGKSVKEAIDESTKGQGLKNIKESFMQGLIAPTPMTVGGHAYGMTKNAINGNKLNIQIANPKAFKVQSINSLIENKLSDLNKLSDTHNIAELEKAASEIISKVKTAPEEGVQNDIENQHGLSSEIGTGEKPVTAEPIQSGSGEEVGGSGVVQKTSEKEIANEEAKPEPTGEVTGQGAVSETPTQETLRTQEQGQENQNQEVDENNQEADQGGEVLRDQPKEEVVKEEVIEPYNGERASGKVEKQGLDFNDEDEYNKYVAENSDNALELAEHYVMSNSQEGSKDYKTEILDDHFKSHGVSEEQFGHYADPENVSPLIGKRFFKKNSDPIDIQAKDLSEQYGVEITPQDIVDHIQDFERKGASKKFKEKGALQQRFAEITGGDNLTLEVAQKIIKDKKYVSSQTKKVLQPATTTSTGKLGEKKEGKRRGKQSATQNLIRENGDESKSKQAKGELDNLTLTHVSGLGMGQNQAKGIYLSTEKEGNRYATKDNPARVAKAKIENPYVTDSHVFAEIRRAAIKEKFGKNSIDDLSDSEMDQLATAMTDHMIKEGYDSIYFPQSETQEGELVVFNRDNVTFEDGPVSNQSEQQNGEPTGEKQGADQANPPPPVSKGTSNQAGEGGNLKQSGLQQRTTGISSDDEAKNQVAEVVKQNPVYYEKMSADGALKEAQDNIVAAGGIDAYYGTLISPTTVEEIPVRQVERMIALGYYGNLLANAIKNNAPKQQTEELYNRINTLQEITAREGTKTGQGSWVFALWKSLDPSALVSFFQNKITKANEAILKKNGFEGTIKEALQTSKEAIFKVAQDESIKVTESDDFNSILEKIIAKRISDQPFGKTKKVTEAKIKLKEAGDKLKAVWNNNKKQGIIWDPKQKGKEAYELDQAVIGYIKALINKIVAEAGQQIKDLHERVKNQTVQYFESIDLKYSSLDDLKGAVDREVNDHIQRQANISAKDIKELIRQHYSGKEEFKKSIADKLISDYGLSESDAKMIQNFVQSKIDQKLKSESQKELTKLYGKSKLPKAKKIKSIVDKINESVNLGVLDEELYKQLFEEHFGLTKPLTAEESDKLRSLSLAVQESTSGSPIESMAVIEMANFMENHYPKESMVDTFFSLAYASMLSGISTTALNLYSTGSNVATKPFRDFVNLSKWMKAVNEGIKDKSVNTFWEYSPLAEMLYVPQTMGYGASKGASVFKEIWANGDLTNKQIEMIKRDKEFKLSPLEKHKYGENRFKPVYITIPKVGKVDLNIFNKYKYSSRNLSAQDAFMFNTMNEYFVAISIRNHYLKQGLRGSALRNAVMDDVIGRNVNVKAIDESLAKDVEAYEKNTGKKLTERQIGLQRQFLIRDSLLSIDKKQLEESADLSRTNTFNDIRGGIIANTANLLGKAINYNAVTAALIKPHIPFTRIVGNVSETMMDAMPYYGLLRANGFGVTGIFKRITGSDIHTSQLGERGSEKYYEQMGRAWFGTIAFQTAATMFLMNNDDDDDFLDITGGQVPVSLRKSHPNYTIRMGDFTFSYLNIPALAVPLSWIGNYKDQRRGFAGEIDDSMMKRWGLAIGWYTPQMIKDMSFVEGIRKLFEMSSDIMSMKKGKVAYGATELSKKYFGTATKPLPQNSAFLQQSSKFLDPTSYSNKDIDDITAYTFGVQHFFNKPSLDIFGQVVKTYPGEDLIPYTAWTGIREKDAKWEFLFNNGLTVNKISNDPITVWNNETNKVEKRSLEPEEFYEYTKKAGEIFASHIDGLLQSNPSLIKQAKDQVMQHSDTGEMKTALQLTVDDLWTESRETAREELFAPKKEGLELLKEFKRQMNKSTDFDIFNEHPEKWQPVKN